MSNYSNTQINATLTNLQGVQNVYFIGIGGIGMSAIARYFYSLGKNVSGYDKTETDLTRELKQSGIDVHYSEDVESIPKNIDLVVYTPAVPKDHKELIYFKQHGYNVVKRSEVLSAITSDTFNICVAGTHGKTTISTILAHILHDSGYGCNAFLGGVSINYNTNFWSSNKNVSVLEADEYDRSFLKLNPDISVITAMDADHLDIYGDEKTMQDAFIEFGNKTKEGGLLLSKFGLKRIKEINVENKLTYSLQNNSADVYAKDIKINTGGYEFNVHLQGAVIENLELKIGGMHNVENSVAAIAIAKQLEIEEEKIVAAIKNFKGIRRRFEYVLPPKPQQEGAYIQPVFIDDYAHHPEELSALLKSVKSLFPQRRSTVIFQPHLFSRTKDLAAQFAESLQLADDIILLPIYPARELPVEGVTSELILNKISSENKRLLSKEDLLQWMKKHTEHIDKEFGEVIITAGAGDIDALVNPIKKIILEAS